MDKYWINIPNILIKMIKKVRNNQMLLVQALDNKVNNTEEKVRKRNEKNQ